MTFGSVGLRLPRLRPFGHPPSLALRRAARALALLVVLPSRAAGLISLSFPQCGHVYCMPEINRALVIMHEKIQSSPLPDMNKQEHKTRREILRKLERTIIEDPALQQYVRRDPVQPFQKAMLEALEDPKITKITLR
jgi:hypothetical protein